MHSEVLIVACPNRLPRIESRGGLAARNTLSGTVHLVSAAATPLGGDTINVRVVVEPGARLALRSAAATIVLPGPDTLTSQACLHLEVAGELDVDLEPTVVAGQSRHQAAVTARIDGPGRLRLRERVQIGRSGERLGFWSGRLHTDVDDLPLLRHRVELGRGSISDDAISAPLALVSELRYPADVVAALSNTAATELALAGGGVLTTWQGDRLLN